MVPKDCPPRSTLQRYFYQWRDAGLWARMNHVLLMDVRELSGHQASPTAGIMDSQSVKTTQSGGPKDYDAGKKTSGRKRHIITDTLGFLVGLLSHTADIQDRDGAVPLLASIRRCYPWLRHIFADGGYAGQKLSSALRGLGGWTAWLGRNRSWAKDFKKPSQAHS